MALLRSLKAMLEGPKAKLSAAEAIAEAREASTQSRRLPKAAAQSPSLRHHSPWERGQPLLVERKSPFSAPKTLMGRRSSLGGARDVDRPRPHSPPGRQDCVHAARRSPGSRRKSNRVARGSRRVARDPGLVGSTPRVVAHEANRVTRNAFPLDARRVAAGPHRWKQPRHARRHGHDDLHDSLHARRHARHRRCGAADASLVGADLLVAVRKAMVMPRETISMALRFAARCPRRFRQHRRLR